MERKSAPALRQRADHNVVNLTQRQDVKALLADVAAHTNLTRDVYAAFHTRARESREQAFAYNKFMCQMSLRGRRGQPFRVDRRSARGGAQRRRRFLSRWALSAYSLRKSLMRDLQFSMSTRRRLFSGVSGF